MRNNIYAVYIGWPKCASTWFHRLCEASPDLAVSRSKDLNFFSNNYARGIDWFLNQVNFDSSDAKPVDINHDYIFSDAALQNIYESSPSTKIIIFLRHPLDWLLSEFNYVTAVANVKCDFETYLNEYPYALEYCRYEALLTRVFKVFPKGAIFIGFQEDLTSDPVSFTNALTDFLGISRIGPGVFNPSRKVNLGIRARFVFVPLLVRAVRNIFRMLGLDGVYGLIKRSAIRKLIFSEGLDKKLSLNIHLNKKSLLWSRQKRIEVETVLGVTVESWRLREKELTKMLGGCLE
jgi:hypothetical protein